MADAVASLSNAVKRDAIPGGGVDRPCFECISGSLTCKLVANRT